MICREKVGAHHSRSHASHTSASCWSPRRQVGRGISEKQVAQALGKWAADVELSEGRLQACSMLSSDPPKAQWQYSCSTTKQWRQDNNPSAGSIKCRVLWEVLEGQGLWRARGPRACQADFAALSKTDCFIHPLQACAKWHQLHALLSLILYYSVLCSLFICK